MTSCVSRSTIGWYTERMRSPSRIARSSAARAASWRIAVITCGSRRQSTNMRTDWPQNARTAISLTFDVDAETGWLGEDPAYADRLSTLSEARYGITRGLPRILELLAKHDIQSTFYV